MTALSNERPLVRVLIVDDTPDIRLLLRFTLERAGDFEVVGEAGNGRDAQTLAEQHRPDVVLLDLAMPVMDGLEALPGLRKLLPDGTIIVLSGFTADAMTNRAIAAGADGYVQKGASPKTIVARIHELAPTALHAVPNPEPPEDEAVAITHPDEAVRLRQLLATVAHEIRNPVFVLMGVADALDGDDDIPAPERSALLAAIGRQARVLEQVTGDLLTAAQTHRGTLQITLEPLVLENVIASSIHGVPGLDGQVAVTGDTHARVLAHPLRLQQVLANLLSNALKYGAAPISIRVDSRDSCTDIVVEDRGEGVPFHFQGQLFTEFSRAPGSDKTGTGLGLYVVRSLVEAQGGVVRYADRPGGGASFTVSLANAMSGPASA